MKGITLKTHAKNDISIITTSGKFSYSRYTLIPKDAPSKALLSKQAGVKSIVPLDSFLGLSGIPFKITPAAMLKIAYWAQNQSSYRRAENAITDALKLSVDNDTMSLSSHYRARKAIQEKGDEQNGTGRRIMEGQAENEAEARTEKADAGWAIISTKQTGDADNTEGEETRQESDEAEKTGAAKQKRELLSKKRELLSKKQKQSLR